MQQVNLKIHFYCTFQKHMNSEVQKPTNIILQSSVLLIILANLAENRNLLPQVQKVTVCDFRLVNFDSF